MTFDTATVENDPFLIKMREELTELEQRKDALFEASAADPSNTKVRLHYDASVIVWARAQTRYHDALRAVIGL